MKSTLIDLIEKHPSFGYVGALVPTTAGVWSLLEAATKIGAFLSVAIGIAVGITTYRVQRLQEKKLRRERFDK